MWDTFLHNFNYTTSGFGTHQSIRFLFNYSINAPLILNVREVIFYASKTHNRQLRGGSGKFGGQKSSGPLEKP
jgi:hypothetical protein